MNTLIVLAVVYKKNLFAMMVLRIAFSLLSAFFLLAIF